ncbi:hypothetical protein K491DRAFT_615099 [Lophiostoma macrostomum CBS 122681]|uniref:Uncharacterized protein n=1 Tax=Lophiostoma macrostomum CBS 122681 TaxID=1314788 RepID=A0A6A6SKJ2_9PLEO|nr:hypothetical protein K491DRAFT_615099 [Lophiostoma macrostomum CBS 122681]
MDSNLVSTNAATGTTGKKFNTFSLCAYGILASGCWTYAAVTYGTGVYAGGSPVMIYGAIGTNIIWSLFLTSMAEMASAYPSGAGLPLYARILAGDRWGPFCVSRPLYPWNDIIVPSLIRTDCRNT